MGIIQDIVEAESEDIIEAIEKCYQFGWTDGLPVVPPTVHRVQEFLDFAQISPDEVIGTFAERRREITAGSLASNAVMAGCLPEHFPVVLAISEALLDPSFNLIGPSSSLGGAAILVIVNGPIVGRLGINCSNNLFGPGNRANSTIGRAVRLILMNTCGTIPGLFDRTVLGHPGKFSYCIAENEKESDWTPLHVERGFSYNDSAVTVFACEGPRQVRATALPETTLYAAVDTISSLGTSMASAGSIEDTSRFVRQGQIALVFAGASTFWDGWSKEDIREFVFPNVKRSVMDLKDGGVLLGEKTAGDSSNFVQLIPRPEDILIIFAGGVEASHIAAIPSWGPKVSSQAVTKLVQYPATNR